MGQITTVLSAKNNLSRSLKAVANSIDKIDASTQKLLKHTKVINININSTYKNVEKINSSQRRTASAIKRNTEEQTRFNQSMHAGVGIASTLTSKLSRMASIYLGVMGMRAFTNVADTMVGAENKFNTLNGFNGKMTDATIQKIYTSSQNSRSSFADNVENIGKLMTNAGQAFDNNMDYAIKFNEIMAKSYVLGGASAAEQASSMYQLIQALGSGRLQGDELRSVRENAPYAYKVMEEYVQKIYDTKESMSELASEGKVTSNLIAEAILNAGGVIDESFAKTQATWGQRWTQIKNDAIMAFTPVIDLWKELLNSAEFIQFMEIMKEVFFNIAQVAYILMNIVRKIFNFIVNNWDVVKYILLVALGIVGALITATTILAVKAAIMNFIFFTGGLSTLLILTTVLFAIFLIIYAFMKWERVAEIVGGVIGVVLATIKIMILGLYNTVILVIYLILLAFQGAANLVQWIVVETIKFISDKFYNLVSDILDMILIVANGFDKLFDTDYSTKVQAEINRNAKERLEVENKLNNVKPFTFADNFLYDATNNKLYDYLTDGLDNGLGNYYKNAWNAGANKGKELHNKVNSFSFEDLFKTDDSYNNAYDPNVGIEYNTGETAKNTKDTADKVGEMATVLKKLADRTLVNRFTSTQVDINLVTNNTINNTDDADGLVMYLTNKLKEEVAISAEAY